MKRVDVMKIAKDVDNTDVDPSDILLTDQVAVVTGGGGGIGQGAALGLAKFGAHVAVLDIVPERCQATTAAIRRLGREAIGIPTDVMNSDQLRDSIAQAADHFGSIDILINNAGGVRGGPFMTMPEASMRRHIEINLVSMLVATQAAVKVMTAGGDGGAIVNVASIEAMRAAPMFAVYAACKAGMVSFTRTMALELAEQGVRVNSIAPDHTITPGMRGNRTGPVDASSWEDSDPTQWSRLIPLGREGVVEECASAIVWLCSTMAEYVTGITVNVDGGTWASGGWLRRDDGSWTLSP